MDAGAILGVTTAAPGISVAGNPTSDTSALFDGDDTTINDVPSGTGL